MTLEKIDSPAVLVDLNIVENNIKTYQAYCDKMQVGLRPHIKTHKIPELAKAQVEAGAVGITCQKISEAEAIISEGGINDILITFNILGEQKLNQLKLLSEKVKLSVVADNFQCLEGLSSAFKNAKSQLAVLVECDTGASRCGVISPEAACNLA